MEGTYILSVLVEDHPGILTRVAGLFSRRGYNIHSLSVGNTHDDTISRITIVVEGDEHIIEQISKQVSKMMEVLKIKILKAGECVSRELALVKVRSTPKTRGEIMEIVSIFRAKIVDISQNTLTIEMSDYGNFEKVGGIGTSLPQNNESITTEPGDIILYQGSSITIYYDTNSWSFTRLGKINDVTRDELLDALGDGDVTVTFSLTAPEGSNGAE